MAEMATKLILMSVLTEGIITYFNEFFISSSSPWKMLASLFLGITVSLAYNLDLPQFLKIKSDFPYIGCVITGILISRGSNYLYDLISTLTLNR